VAEHESRGESVLPVDVLTDLVRSYTTQAQSVVPQFLAMSFEMLRESQSKMMENLSNFPSPMATMPGFDALTRQQQAFLKTMMGGWSGASSGPEPEADAPARTGEKEELAQIKKQLADLQSKLSKL